MFKFNRVTRVVRNANDGSNQSGGNFGGGFPGSSDPFSQAGNNIWNQLETKANGGNNPEGVQAPTMQNGMPQGAGQPPVESMKPNATSHMQPEGDGSQQQGVSSLDNFMPKPDNNPNGDGNNQPATTSNEPTKSIFDTDIDGWKNVTQNVDLTEGVEPEKVTAALGGDAQAFMEVLTMVSRNTLNQAAFMSTRVAGQGVTNALNDFQGKVPSLIENHQFSNMWEGDAIMNHPTSKPMVEALTTQFRTQFPQASLQEIQTKVKEYFTAFTGEFSGANKETPTAPQQTNLSKFFQQQ